jgi:hypothetical protein
MQLVSNFRYNHKAVHFVKNKYNHEYHFRYYSDTYGYTYLNYKTNKGINNAIYYANNNMKFDAGRGLTLLSRKQIGDPYQENIDELKTSQVGFRTSLFYEVSQLRSM